MSGIRNGRAAHSIRIEYRQINKKTVVLVPLLLLFLAIFTRWVCGSPLYTLHFVGAKEIVPPIWLMVLMFSASYVVAGLSLGVALGNRFCACAEKKYQGAMYFIISLASGYIWYPIFFCARLFLVSAILSAVCLLSSIVATFCFVNVSRLSFFLAIIYDAWLIYLTLLNMQIFFAI